MLMDNNNTTGPSLNTFKYVTLLFKAMANRDVKCTSKKVLVKIRLNGCTKEEQEKTSHQQSNKQAAAKSALDIIVWRRNMVIPVENPKWHNNWKVGTSKRCIGITLSN